MTLGSLSESYSCSDCIGTLCCSFGSMVALGGRLIVICPSLFPISFFDDVWSPFHDAWY